MHMMCVVCAVAVFILCIRTCYFIIADNLDNNNTNMYTYTTSLQVELLFDHFCKEVQVYEVSLSLFDVATRWDLIFLPTAEQRLALQFRSKCEYSAGNRGLLALWMKGGPNVNLIGGVHSESNTMIPLIFRELFKFFMFIYSLCVHCTCCVWVIIVNKQFRYVYTLLHPDPCFL